MTKITTEFSKKLNSKIRTSKRWKNLFSTSLLIAALLGVSSPTLALEVVFSHTVPHDTPKGKMAMMFKSIVEKRLPNVTVTIYPNSSLVNDAQVAQAIIDGKVHLAAPAMAKLLPFNESLKVFDLPFLFEDLRAVEKFQQSNTGHELLQQFGQSGLLGLSYMNNGMKQLSGINPLVWPEDAEGMKFRIMNSEVLKRQFEVVNAQPIPLAWPKVPGALATGQVSGQENTWSNIYSANLFEHQPFITHSDHGVLSYVVVTSQKFWQSLPYEYALVFNHALKVSVAYGNATAKAKENNDRQRIQDTRVSTILPLTNDQRAAWRRVMESVWQDFSHEIDPQVVSAAIAANQ